MRDGDITQSDDTQSDDTFDEVEGDEDLKKKSPFVTSVHNSPEFVAIIQRPVNQNSKSKNNVNTPLSHIITRNQESTIIEQQLLTENSGDGDSSVMKPAENTQNEHKPFVIAPPVNLPNIPLPNFSHLPPWIFGSNPNAQFLPFPQVPNLSNIQIPVMSNQQTTDKNNNQQTVYYFVSSNSAPNLLNGQNGAPMSILVTSQQKPPSETSSNRKAPKNGGSVFSTNSSPTQNANNQHFSNNGNAQPKQQYFVSNNSPFNQGNYGNPSANNIPAYNQFTTPFSNINHYYQPNNAAYGTKISTDMQTNANENTSNLEPRLEYVPAVGIAQPGKSQREPRQR